MSKFKVGDKVVRSSETESEAWKDLKSQDSSILEYATVTRVVGDWIQLNDFMYDGDKVPFFEGNYKLYEPAVQPEPAQQNDATCASWDYAVAESLSIKAKAAVKAYNEYISRKPSTYFHPMIEG